MSEGFENWVSFDSQTADWLNVWCGAFRENMKYVDPTGLGYFTRFICGICAEEEKLQGIRAYAHIFQQICKAYAALEADHTDLDAEWNRIALIARTMYDLDDGLAPPDGFEPIVPDLTQEETQRRLTLLDAGRAKFARVLRLAFAHITLFADRNLLIAWASKVYYHVHCFQAPPRFDAAQATRDAMGQSDHFRELLDEVLAQCPEAKSK